MKHVREILIGASTIMLGLWVSICFGKTIFNSVLFIVDGSHGIGLLIWAPQLTFSLALLLHLKDDNHDAPEPPDYARHL